MHSLHHGDLHGTLHYGDLHGTLHHGDLHGTLQHGHKWDDDLEEEPTIDWNKALDTMRGTSLIVTFKLAVCPRGILCSLGNGLLLSSVYALLNVFFVLCIAVVDYNSYTLVCIIVHFSRVKLKCLYQHLVYMSMRIQLYQFVVLIAASRLRSTSCANKLFKRNPSIIIAHLLEFVCIRKEAPYMARFTTVANGTLIRKMTRNPTGMREVSSHYLLPNS